MQGNHLQGKTLQGADAITQQNQGTTGYHGDDQPLSHQFSQGQQQNPLGTTGKTGKLMIAQMWQHALPSRPAQQGPQELSSQQGCRHDHTDKNNEVNRPIAITAPPFRGILRPHGGSTQQHQHKDQQRGPATKPEP